MDEPPLERINLFANMQLITHVRYSFSSNRAERNYSRLLDSMSEFIYGCRPIVYIYLWVAEDYKSEQSSLFIHTHILIVSFTVN